MRPTTKTKRESTRQATRHTQSRSSLKQKVNYYLSNPMGGSNPRRAKETMLFTTKGNKNDHIIPLSTQREKEIGWPCPTTNTKRQRAREYGRQATTHTKPSNTKTKKLTLHHSIIKTKREREDVFHHHQNKMRESTDQATTAHTKPFITTTK